MERASRQIVIASILLASAGHAWLAHTPLVTLLTAVVFAVMFTLGRYLPLTALSCVAFTAYTAPALLSAAFGRYDHHQLSLWLVGASGALIAQAAPDRWEVPPRWRFPVIAWALVIACSWPIVAGREVDFSIVAARTYGVVNGAAQQSPPLSSAFTILIALTQLVTLLWFDVLFQRFRDDVRAAARVVGVPFVVGIALSASVGIYQRMVDADFLNLPIWSNLVRAGGLMNDANTLGIGAAAWAALSAAVAWLLGTRWVGLGAYLLLGAGMWAAGSRTALLAFAAGSIGLVIGALQQRGLWQPRMGRVAALVGVALLLIVVTLIPRQFDAGNPLMRALDRVPRLEVEEIRRFVIDDLWVRFGYGQAAVDIIRDHPVTGIGVGAFHIIAPEYIYRDTGRVLASDNAQNWWRHQLAELGFAGALPAIWLSLLVVALLLRGKSPRELEGAVTIVRAAIVGIGLASLLGVPTQHPATSTTLATATFWLYAMRSTPGANPHTRRGVVAAAFALALLVSAGLLMTARGELRPLTRALQSGVPHVQGLSPIEGLADQGEFRWTGTEAIAAVPVRNRWMQLTIWAPYRDVERRQIVIAVAVEGREVLRHAFADSEATSFFIEMPEGKRSVTVHYTVTGAVPRDRAVQIATLFRPEVPAGMPSARVLR